MGAGRIQESRNSGRSCIRIVLTHLFAGPFSLYFVLKRRTHCQFREAVSALHYIHTGSTRALTHPRKTEPGPKPDSNRHLKPDFHYILKPELFRNSRLSVRRLPHRGKPLRIRRAAVEREHLPGAGGPGYAPAGGPPQGQGQLVRARGAAVQGAREDVHHGPTKGELAPEP